MAKQFTPETNPQLWKAFKKGDKAAFSTIFRGHYSEMYFYGLKLIQQEAVVQDEIQNLFTELWERRRQLGDIEHIRAYLLKSLRRRLLKSVEKSRKQISLRQVIHKNHFTEFEISIEDIMVRGEQRQINVHRLKDALIQLNKTQKEIIYLKFYNDLDYKEIATITGLKYQSIRNSMHKALKVLRSAFDVAE